MKWILSEEHLSYQSYDLYIKKCKELNLLPMSLKFDLNDLVLFHKIINGLIPVSLPDYLKLFDGHTRLRSTHLDNLSYVSDLVPRGNSTNLLNKSFFFRTHSLWNALPLEIRKIENSSIFKSNVTKNLWEGLKREINNLSDEFIPDHNFDTND